MRHVAIVFDGLAKVAELPVAAWESIPEAPANSPTRLLADLMDGDDVLDTRRIPEDSAVALFGRSAAEMEHLAQDLAAARDASGADW